MKAMTKSVTATFSWRVVLGRGSAGVVGVSPMLSHGSRLLLRTDRGGGPSVKTRTV